MNREAEHEPVTVDWLIDTICPNKGNSPLMNYNKKRLRELIDRLVIEGQQGASEKPQPVEQASGKQVDNLVFSTDGQPWWKPMLMVPGKLGEYSLYQNGPDEVWLMKADTSGNGLVPPDSDPKPDSSNKPSEAQKGTL